MTDVVGPAHVTPTTRSLVAHVPDYDPVTRGAQKSLLRLGAYEVGEEEEILKGLEDLARARKTKPEAATDAWAISARAALEVPPVKPSTASTKKQFPGWLEYTDGDRTVAVRGDNRQAYGGDSHEFIRGDKVESIGGKYRLNIGAGTQEVYNADPIYFVELKETGIKADGKATWRRTEKGHLSADTYTFGDTESFFAGYKFDGMFGLTNNVFLGGKVDVSLAAAFNAFLGFDLEVGVGMKYSYVYGKNITQAEDQETKAFNSIHLRIKEKHTSPTWSTTKKIAVVVSAIGGAAVVGLAAGTHGPVGHETDITNEGLSHSTGGLLGAASAAFAVGLVAAVVAALVDKNATQSSKSEIKLDQDGVVIRSNDVAGEMESQIEIAGQNIRLRNARDSGLSINRHGDVRIKADQDVQLENNSSNATVRLRANGEIVMRAPAINVAGGKARIGANGELRVI